MLPGQADLALERSSDTLIGLLFLAKLLGLPELQSYYM